MNKEKMRVLVIDPGGWHGCLLRTMLESSGYAVETCPSFEKGERLAEEAPYDCVVLAASGREDDCARFHASLRSASPSTKIIYLTRRRGDAQQLPCDELTFSSVAGF